MDSVFTKKEYVKFSKRLTRTIITSWILFRVASLLILFFKPEINEAITQFQKGADDVMMVAIGFYCGNSVVEKGIKGYFGSRTEQEEYTDNSSDFNDGGEIKG